MLLRRGRDLLLPLGRADTVTTTPEMSLVVVSSTLVGSDVGDVSIEHKTVCFVHWSDPRKRTGRIVDIRDGKALAPAFVAVRDFRSAEVALASLCNVSLVGVARVVLLVLFALHVGSAQIAWVA